MKRAVSVVAMACIVVILAGAGVAWSTEFPAKIISAEWLKDNIDKMPSLRIIDVRTAEEYAKGHIPGAVNLPYGELRVEVTGVKSVRRPPEDWEKLMGQRLGVDENDAIVAYTGKNPQEAGRVVWECNYYGHERAAMLNGGFDAWVKAGGKVTTDVPKITPTYYVIKSINEDVLATNNYVMKHMKEPGHKVVDVRNFQQFSGAQAGKGITRAGHIPGAVNIPMGKFVDDGYVKPPAEIVKELESKGVTKEDTVVLTCRTGNQTCAVYPALSSMGYKVKMHDYSWTGWNEDMELPAEK